MTVVRSEEGQRGPLGSLAPARQSVVGWIAGLVVPWPFGIATLDGLAWVGRLWLAILGVVLLVCVRRWLGRSNQLLAPSSAASFLAGAAIPVFSGGFGKVVNLSVVWEVGVVLVAVAAFPIAFARWRASLAMLAFAALAVVSAEAAVHLQPTVRGAQVSLVKSFYSDEIEDGRGDSIDGLYVWIWIRPLGPDGGIGAAYDSTGRLNITQVNQRWSTRTADPGECYEVDTDWYWCGGDINPPSFGLSLDRSRRSFSADSVPPVDGAVG